jgi:acetyl-CoA acetyltransferase
MISMMDDPTTSRAFRDCGRVAFGEAGIKPGDVDHLMLYDAFAFLPIFALEDLGFVGRGEAGAFISEGNTGPGGVLPLNTTGGGLSYVHTGMYGMFAMQESIRQVRGVADAQVDGVEISVAHAVGGYFWAASTLVMASA